MKLNQSIQHTWVWASQWVPHICILKLGDISLSANCKNACSRTLVATQQHLKMILIVAAQDYYKHWFDVLNFSFAFCFSSQSQVELSVSNVWSWETVTFNNRCSLLKSPIRGEVCNHPQVYPFLNLGFVCCILVLHPRSTVFTLFMFHGRWARHLTEYIELKLTWKPSNDISAESAVLMINHFLLEEFV